MPDPRVISPRLPLAVRARLHAEARIDRVGYWLSSHRAPGLAQWLWRACRML